MQVLVLIKLPCPKCAVFTMLTCQLHTFVIYMLDKVNTAHFVFYLPDRCIEIETKIADTNLHLQICQKRCTDS